MFDRFTSSLLVLLLFAHAAWALTADEAREATGVTTGVAVVLPVTDGSLEVGLAEGGRMLAQGLAVEAAAGKAARAAIDEAGLAGLASVRVVRDPRRLPYSEEMVNLLIVDADALGDRVPDEAELRRVLIPVRGRGVREAGRGVDEAHLAPARGVRHLASVQRRARVDRREQRHRGRPRDHGAVAGQPWVDAGQGSLQRVADHRRLRGASR